MDFTESDEHALLREAVRAVGAKFGHEYYAQCTRDDIRPEDFA